MDLSERLGPIAEKTPQAVRFHALRMMIEVQLGRRLTVPEQKRVFNKAGAWRPETEEVK